MLVEKSNNNPDISIIVPVYNVANWLGKCIDSILKQDFNNYELLLIDDGSTDNSSKICHSFLAKDSRIKYFFKANGGLSDARNYGLKRAKGKYIVFIDSDDYIKSNFLSVLYNSIEKSQAEVAICGLNWVDEDENTIYEVPLKRVETRRIITGRQLLEDVFKKEGYVFVVVWNKIYKRKIFENIHFEVGRLYEDEFINYQLFWNIKKVSLESECSYNYVQRTGSIKNSEFSIKKFTDFNALHRKRLEFYKMRDKKLYYLANKAYRQWLVSTFSEARNVLSSETKKYMQKEYRKLKKEDHEPMTVSPLFFQDKLAYINLPLTVYIRNIINIMTGKEK